MKGLIDVGEDYLNAATSGEIRTAGEQERINQENAKLKNQGQEQGASMASSGVGAAASIGLMIAKVC